MFTAKLAMRAVQLDFDDVAENVVRDQLRIIPMLILLFT